MKLVDFIWPNSPLVVVKGRHTRRDSTVRCTWDDLEDAFFTGILNIGDTLKFDVRLESDSTSGDCTFHIKVRRLDRHEDVVEVIHDKDNYYVNNNDPETVTISTPITDAKNWISFRVTIRMLKDRSISGAENWSESQSRKYEAIGIGDPSKWKWPRCFIATAAYGSEMAPPVQFLREFRDNTVLKSRYSRFFEKILDVYYTFSPPIAKAMMEHRALKFVIKYVIVWPFVKLAQACALIINFFH